MGFGDLVIAALHAHEVVARREGLRNKSAIFVGAYHAAGPLRLEAEQNPRTLNRIAVSVLNRALDRAGGSLRGRCGLLG